eukprot:6183498-Pleurochrysis_carterae.AAC.1
MMLKLRARLKIKIRLWVLGAEKSLQHSRSPPLPLQPLSNRTPLPSPRSLRRALACARVMCVAAPATSQPSAAAARLAAWRAAASAATELDAGAPHEATRPRWRR